MHMEQSEKRFLEFQQRVFEIQDLRHAENVLSWDQSTYMPPGGADARGHQMGTLHRLAHERLTDDALARLLDELGPYEQSLPYDSFPASLIRIIRREHIRWRGVPAEFVARQAEISAQTYQVWMRARPESDFAAVLPWLERVLDCSRELADFLPPLDGARAGAHPADPLIALLDYGMGAAEVRELFARLRAALVPLVDAITAEPPADDEPLHRRFPEAQQIAFGTDVVRRIGYDFGRGHVDKAAHPFTTHFSAGDVRITTRVNEHDVSDCLFSMIHEAGHALYEQGIDPALERTPLDSGVSSGMHESQSRLWENLVGRSRPFWEYFYPQLQRAFPAQLGDVTLERFYRAINKVQRSLVRTEADEVTYNLHVMLRFDIELAMLEGALAVRDLPDAWNARMQSDLGITPPNDALGAMQDIHWFWGQIGGQFQGYTLGNLISAQIFDAAVRAHPEIPGQLGGGEFDVLRGWLRDAVYRHGSIFTPPELIERATGQPLTIEPYIRYLRRKYGELYSI